MHRSPRPSRIAHRASRTCTYYRSLFVSPAQWCTTRRAVPDRTLPACAALPFPFSTAPIIAAPAIRSGSEPPHRIDLRGMLGARARCIPLRLPYGFEGHIGRAGAMHVLAASNPTGHVLALANIPRSRVGLVWPVGSVPISTRSLRSGRSLGKFRPADGQMNGRDGNCEFFVSPPRRVRPVSTRSRREEAWLLSTGLFDRESSEDQVAAFALT